MYNSNKIAERIKTTAKNKGVSIKKLLEDIGLSYNTMTNMKTSVPKADNLAKIADYLECSVDYLLGRVDSPEIQKEKSMLIEYYDSLNREGQEQVFKYTKNLSKIDEYKKCDDSENMNVG